MEVDAADVAFEGGVFSSAKTDKTVSFQDVALEAHLCKNLPPDTEPGLSATRFFEPANFAFPFGAHIAVVEVDRETGEIQILRYLAVDDCGKVINPLMVDGQIHGGVAQGLGPALMEGVIYDEDGQLMNGTFMDYPIPQGAAHALDRERPHRDTRTRQSLGSQGGWRSRDHRVAARLCQRRRRRLVAFGRRAH